MAEHRVTMQLKHDTTWKSLKERVTAEGIPDEAKVDCHKVAGDRPFDAGYTNLVFTWGQGTW